VNAYSYKDAERAHFDRLAEDIGAVWWGSVTAAGIQRLRRRARAIADLLPALNTSGPRLFELGCGTGALTEHLAAVLPTVVMTCCDISPKTVEIARQRLIKHPRITFVEGDAENTGLPSGHFHLTVGNSVLHHLNAERALRECYRLLSPGGVLWFSEPNMLNPQIALEKNVRAIGRWLQNSEDETAFFRWSLARLLRDIGFVDIKVIPYDFLHPGVPASLWRLLNALGYFLEGLPVIREFAGSLIVQARKKEP
jgi:ubiquinone/menaquinone biosynthesis C-methylase UbiE